MIPKPQTERPNPKKSCDILNLKTSDIPCKRIQSNALTPNSDKHREPEETLIQTVNPQKLNKTRPDTQTLTNVENLKKLTQTVNPQKLKNRT